MLMKLRGYALIIAAAALWGMIGPFSKLALEEGLAPLEVAFWRGLLAWFFFAAHAGLTKQVRFEKQDAPAIIFFGIIGVTLFFGSYQMAVDRGGVAMAAVLLYTAPAWVALMSGVFFKEKITPVKTVALVLTLVGVAGVSSGGADVASGIRGGIDFSAVFWGLLAGFCYALYYIFGKHFSSRYSTPNLFLYILPIGITGLLPWVTFTPKTLKAWSALLANAFLCTYVAYIVYYAGLKCLEATRAAITATLEPVIAALIAYLWWHEYFTARGYAGSFLVLAAVLLMILDSSVMHEKCGSPDDGAASG